MWGNRARSVVTLGMLAQQQAAITMAGCDNPPPQPGSSSKDAGVQPQAAADGGADARDGASAGHAAGSGGPAGTAASHAAAAGATGPASGGSGGSAGSTPVTPQIDRGSVAANTLPDIDDAAYAKLIKQLNQFGLELGQRHVEADALTQKNSIYSPLSVAIALSMTYAGARGETAAQMNKLLAGDTPADVYHTGVNRLTRELMARAQTGGGTAQRIDLSLVDALYADKSLQVHDAFLDELAQNYDSGLYREDFANAHETARTHINDWVADKTHDRIKDLLQPDDIDELTRFVIVNALYFYGAWQWPFDSKDTRDEDFHTLDGSIVKVPTMHNEESQMHFAGDGFQVVDVSYIGSNFSMALILPDPGQFEKLREGLNGSWLNTTLKDLTPKGISLALPKFKLTSDTFSLKSCLKDMGMKAAFSDDADLSGITQERLRVLDVLQKAFVAVTEQGTEAGAATAVVGGFLVANTEFKPVSFDRPFLFVIHDAAGLVLFSGQVVNPAM